ncbi:acetolactate synthase catalytic subunit [Schizosaccharomyces japonicus yFS275]|uniref:Acetolactate synthase n=1 Tax=Schizosaccharomyces japonicus (strain yFS275 / FY16936) TaxID=402676 RepID=B6K5L0_SCHJY|nr:acetolactate synthase catalytic subunit [Schizosaccharomyces japonicus yFS275]EEB08814.1 acetolactate synthase catalytic subunit [Schizosaccharomyces japonicus yFS275]
MASPALLRRVPRARFGAICSGQLLSASGRTLNARLLLSRTITNSTKLSSATTSASIASTGVRATTPDVLGDFQKVGANTRYDNTYVGKTGGEIFHDMMLKHNVKNVFGYPGGAILPVFDAIYKSPYFDFVLPRHEQGAGHAAQAYARATGKPGVVLVTSGPGATNVITPIADAMADGTPLVVFCGQVATAAIGTDAFQEADMVGISRPCTKWNVMVKDVADLPRRIDEAFEIATSGRPGPVLVDLPKDVTASVLKNPIPVVSSMPTFTRKIKETLEERSKIIDSKLDRVQTLLSRAKKPVIFAGHGILSNPDGPKVLRELSEKLSIPVTTTLLGLGAFDERSDLSLHMIGMHGSGYANMAVQEADCLLALGARFDDRVTGNTKLYAPEARLAGQEERGGIIHFDISPKNIGKVIRPTEAIEGDVTEMLKLLLPRLTAVSRLQREEWLSQIASWKKRFPFTFTPSKPGELLKPQAVIQELDRQTAEIKDKVVITTGVGAHQMWAATFYRWTQPRSLITSGGLGTMGFGLPAAIGASVARPDSIVIDIDGDASFSMTGMEMATVRQFNLPVKILLLNNEEQGMVTQWQNLFYQKRYSHTQQVNPDFPKLAEAMGLKGLRVTKQEELAPTMKQFLETEGPVLMEVKVASKEHVYPFVPAGKALHQFILHGSLS